MTIPTHMKQIGFATPGGPEVMQLAQVATPSPGPGDLLIRVEATGINRPDVLQRQGQYPVPAGASPVLGLEVAGEVVAVGHGDTRFQVGERVCALANGGGYAEYVTVPATQALRWPVGYDAVRAAALPETFFTVWANLFMMGRAKAGETLLVHGGTSGIGSTALMLAKEMGLHAVSTDGGPEKGAAAVQLGAEFSIDYRTQAFVPEVMRWTSGRGVDLILDIMGAGYFEQNLGALAKDGRLLLIGFMAGDTVDKFSLLPIMLKRLTVTGSTMRGRSTEEKAAIARELHALVWPALSAGRCVPHVHQVFDLDQAAEAHRLMESRGHIGKIVLKV